MSKQVESYTVVEQEWMDQIIAHEYQNNSTLSHLAEPFVAYGFFSRAEQCRLWNECQPGTIQQVGLSAFAKHFVPIGFARRIQQCRLWNEHKKRWISDNGDLYD